MKISIFEFFSLIIEKKYPVYVNEKKVEDLSLIKKMINETRLEKYYLDYTPPFNEIFINKYFMENEVIKEFITKNKIKVKLAEDIKNHQETLPFTYSLINTHNFFERENELYLLEILLNKKIKSNILLLGEEGVGKTALVAELSKKYKILGLNLAEMIAGTHLRGAFEKRIEMVLEKCIENKIVLFIDEIHSVYTLGNSEGGISLSNILKPYLSQGELKVIGATTIDEVKILKADKAFMRRFFILEIYPLNYENIKKNIKLIKESFISLYNINIEDEHLLYILENLNKKIKPNLLLDSFLDSIDIILSIAEKENIVNINKNNVDNILAIMKNVNLIS